MTKPVRQCICCKGRLIQEDLNRFLCIDNNLYHYTANKGRSLYICNSCLAQKNKKLLKALNYHCKKKYKNVEEFFENIRSI